MVRRKDKKGRVLEKGESQRKDGLYVYQYKDFYGVRKSIYSRDLNELRKQKKQIIKDLDDRIDTKGAEITLNEQFDKYMALKKQLANSTRQNYIGLWNSNIRNSPLGNKRLCDIKRSDILNFYNSLVGKGLSYSTLKAFQGMISPCMELAVRDDMIRKNPCNDCLQEFNNDSKKKNSLTIEQQNNLLDFVKTSDKYSIYYPMLVIMISTAMRCGELIGLTWNDINLKNKEISVNHQLLYKKNKDGYGFYADTPKTDAGIRIIPLTSLAINAIKEQRLNQMALGRRTNVEIDGYKDFVFSTKHKNPIMPSAINNILLNIVNSYNRIESIDAVMSNREPEYLPHISAHILRHTGCTRMAEAGIDVKVLQYIMGHSRISVTMEVYNHISSERNHKEMDKLENIKLIV